MNLSKLVPKHLVNQSFEEDVLVYNVRLALPVYIDNEFFQTQFRAQLNPKELDLFLKYYHPNKLYNSEGIKQEVYLLQSVYYQIDVAEYEKMLDSDISEDDKTVLKSNYKINKNNNTYDLYRDFENFDDNTINRIFNRCNCHVPKEDKVELSRIFEKTEGFEFPPDYYGEMYVNTNHYYFYRKDYEHIPGMMILETARQFGYVVSYRYMNVPYGKVMFVLTNINIQFSEFLQSNFPVYVQASDLPYNRTSKKNNRSIGYDMTFYQKNRPVAKIKMEAKIMTHEIFKRIRKGFDDDYSHRFRPNSKFDDIGYFVNIYTQEKLKGQLKEISLQDVIVQFDNEYKFLDEDRFEFFIYIKNIGIIQGICLLKKYYLRSENNTVAHFEFEFLSQSDKEDLKEAIKRYTILIA